MVDRIDGAGVVNQILYPRAIVSSLFGGVADYVRWTPRIDDKELDSGISLGSKVLLLCVNANTRSAYIVRWNTKSKF